MMTSPPPRCEPKAAPSWTASSGVIVSPTIPRTPETDIMRVMGVFYSPRLLSVSLQLAKTVDVFSDLRAEVARVHLRKWSEGGEGALVAGFEIGRVVEKKEALALEDTETAARAAERFAANG